jgi:ribose 1,5-bisphosphokinase PhnN
MNFNTSIGLGAIFVMYNMLMRRRGRSGKVFLLVGPSGVGKNTLMNGIVSHFNNNDTPCCVFPERSITRPTHHPDDEKHEIMTEAEFATCERSGEFAVTWEAYGFHYGIKHNSIVSPLETSIQI